MAFTCCRPNRLPFSCLQRSSMPCGISFARPQAPLRASSHHSTAGSCHGVAPTLPSRPASESLVAHGGDSHFALAPLFSICLKTIETWLSSWPAKRARATIMAYRAYWLGLYNAVCTVKPWFRMQQKA